MRCLWRYANKIINSKNYIIMYSDNTIEKNLFFALNLNYVETKQMKIVFRVQCDASCNCQYLNSLFKYVFLQNCR